MREEIVVWGRLELVRSRREDKKRIMGLDWRHTCVYDLSVLSDKDNLLSALGP